MYQAESILTSNAQQVKDLTKTKTTYESHAMASFFGRVNYSYKGKYYLRQIFVMMVLHVLLVPLGIIPVCICCMACF